MTDDDAGTAAAPPDVAEAPADSLGAIEFVGCKQLVVLPVTLLR